LEQVYVPRWRSNLKLRYSKGVQCTAQTIRDYRTTLKKKSEERSTLVLFKFIYKPLKGS